MAHERRQFKGLAAPCTLGSDILANGLTVTLVGDYTGWPDGSTGKFGICVDRAGTVEYLLGQSRTLNTVTIASTGDRGIDDSVAAPHGANVTVEHVHLKRDFDEANELVAALALNSCRVYNSADFAVSPGDGTLVAVTFNSERYDTGALHSTSVNTSRLTCVTAGKYSIFGNIAWDSNATGFRQLSIVLNSSTPIANVVVAAVNGIETPQSIATHYALAVNDYVELKVSQSSGGSLNVKAHGNQSPEFGMALVGL